MFDWVNLETLAVVLSIAYLILAMKENSLCWFCAFFSTAIYVWIFGDVNLYMESGLNLYYMAMAVYGWHQWQHGGSSGKGVLIATWGLRNHISALLMILLATIVSGYLLDANSDARLPYVDSFTTWASILSTVMVAKKVLENWLYWIVIDSVSIFLYLDRGLHQTAAMFALYLVLAAVGYCSWRKNYHRQNSATTASNSI